MADAVFQFAPETTGGGRLGVSGAAPSLGVSGGNSTNDGAVSFADTTDIGAGSSLPDFLLQAFAPKMEAIKQQRIFEGYTQAAIGRSQEEISKDVPWYSKVFGPVPYELGAQKFTVDKTMADMDAYYMNEMPRLRTLDPHTVAKEIQEKALENVGGNPYSSMLVTQSLMERMGPMLDMHTKARYAWQQDEMVRMQSEGAVAAAGSYEASRRRISELGKTRPNDPELGAMNTEITRNFLRAIAPPEHQDDASIEKYVTRFVMDSADAGHFGAVNLLAQTGMGQTIDPGKLRQLQGYVDRKWEEQKDKVLVEDPDFHRRVVLAQTAAAQGVGGEATTEDLRAIDQEYLTRYGYKGYFDGAAYVSKATQSSNAWISNEEQAQREAAAAARAALPDDEKAAAEARDVAIMRNGWLTGQTSFIDALHGIKKDLHETVIVSTWREMDSSNPVVAAQGLIWNQSNEGKPVAEIQRILKQRVDNFTNGPYNDGYLKLQEQWDTMRAGTGFRLNPLTGKPDMQDTLAGLATARVYFGDENSNRMERFAALRQAGTPLAVAYAQTWGDDPTARPTLPGATKEDVKEARRKLDSAITDLGPSMYKSVFGGDTDARLNRSSRQFVSAYASEEYSALPDNGDVASKVKNTMNNVRAKGIEIHGQYAWKNPLGAQQPRIASYFNSNDTAFSPVIDQTITNKLKAVGVHPSDDTITTVQRLPDVNGKPVLSVFVQDGDLQWKSVEINAFDIDEVRKAGPQKPVEIPLRPRAGGRNVN